MSKNLEALKKHLDQLINKKVTRAQLGWGSFLTFDFGKDIEESISTTKGIKTYVHGEWHIWVYMTFWEIEHHGEIVLHCEDEREKIQAFLKKIENKALLDYEITSEKFDAYFSFEDEIDLYLIANTEEDDYEQWYLFTPYKKTFTAGPQQTVSIEESEKP